ncbi:Membrane-associated progesterone-binding protein 4 [Hibiscus syriacus]|uniref:Membrane-associated progesterone-binding protein 4 n=1 Tax=Hibiscus syriacus TaxID=106335 RepID=A0A6A3A9K6_HIBSY|nr:Membrane-associated progesterone-binding protein 4 [Hibiscus syriacus]
MASSAKKFIASAFFGLSLLKLFSAQELALSNGTDESLPILLGILGSVFDVTKGKSHYGVGGGYHHFAGRLGTAKARVTLPTQFAPFANVRVHSVVGWRDFYIRSYRFVGRLVGLYYDSQGNPTKYLKGAEAKAARGAQLMEKQKEMEAKQPSCKSRWSQDDGGELCTLTALKLSWKTFQFNFSKAQ